MLGVALFKYYYGEPNGSYAGSFTARPCAVLDDGGVRATETKILQLVIQRSDSDEESSKKEMILVELIY